MRPGPLVILWTLFALAMLVNDVEPKMKGLKIHKPKPVKIKPVKVKPIKLPKAKPIKIKLPKIKLPKIHLHKKQRHHAADGLSQSKTPVPLFSPNFTGIDTGQLPMDAQVDLIVDWLTRIKVTLDVFLRMMEMKEDDEEAQRVLIRDLYPPVHPLLEAQYAFNVTLLRLENSTLVSTTDATAAAVALKRAKAKKDKKKREKERRNREKAKKKREKERRKKDKKKRQCYCPLSLTDDAK